MLQICNDWLASTPENEASGSSTVNEPRLDQGVADLLLNTEGNLDFSRPSFVSSWAENSFVVAFNRAEKLSNHVRNMDGEPTPILNNFLSHAFCSQLTALGFEFAQLFDCIAGTAGMPDAMETIYRKALAFGTDGAVSILYNAMFIKFSCLVCRWISLCLCFRWTSLRTKVLQQRIIPRHCSCFPLLQEKQQHCL